MRASETATLAQTIQTLHRDKQHLITPAARQSRASGVSKQLLAYKFALGLVQGMGLALGWLLIQLVIQLTGL